MVAFVFDVGVSCVTVGRHFFVVRAYMQTYVLSTVLILNSVLIRYLNRFIEGVCFYKTAVPAAVLDREIV